MNTTNNVYIVFLLTIKLRNQGDVKMVQHKVMKWLKLYDIVKLQKHPKFTL